MYYQNWTSTRDFRKFKVELFRKMKSRLLNKMLKRFVTGEKIDKEGQF